jgi:hypothetical protein
MARTEPSEAVQRIVYEAVIKVKIDQLDRVIVDKVPPEYAARVAPLKRRAVEVKTELVYLLDDLQNGIGLKDPVEAWRAQRRLRRTL